MATIHDVAKRAGVSSATVSRVMNHSPSVLPETQRRVEEAIRTLHYEPNSFSRALRMGQSRILLVLLPALDNVFYGGILEAMDEQARAAGYTLLIVPTHLVAERERSMCAFLKKRQADGAVFLASTLPNAELEALNDAYPVVLLCEHPPVTRVPYVCIDNYQAFYELTGTLIARGCRRVAMISSTNGFLSTVERERGYMQALHDAHIPFDPALLVRGNYDFASGYSLTRDLLRSSPPQAVAAISDSVAAGAICAVLDAGLRVPQDICVTGFDGQPFSHMMRPGISTVVQPCAQLGRAAVSMLLSRLEEGVCAPSAILPYELVWRGSVIPG